MACKSALAIVQDSVPRRRYEHKKIVWGQESAPSLSIKCYDVCQCAELRRVLDLTFHIKTLITLDHIDCSCKVSFFCISRHSLMMVCSKPKHVTWFISLKISCVKLVNFFWEKYFVNAWPFLKLTHQLWLPKCRSSWPSLAYMMNLNCAVRLCRK